MISVELSVIGGKHTGQVIRLDRKKFLIGREQDCQLRPNSELVSRHHCVFTVDDFSVRLRDLGSTNGTVVNGERIRKEVVLQPGDHVIVGSLEFEVKINEPNIDDSVPKPAAGDTAANSETIVAGNDTLSEMPPISPAEVVAANEATPLPSATPITEIPVVPAAAVAPAAPPQTLAAGTGDTTVISQPMMHPGQMPYQPMMPQMGGYPMYGNYPYMGMPQQMPMYQQPYPNQMPMPGYPQQMQQEVAPPQEATKSAAEFANLALPDPAETGLKPEPPKPVETEPAAEAGTAEKSNSTAAAIIQKHMQRRPGG